jgi:hypothetical protein
MFFFLLNKIGKGMEYSRPTVTVSVKNIFSYETHTPFFFFDRSVMLPLINLVMLGSVFFRIPFGSNAINLCISSWAKWCFYFPKIIY